MPIRSDCRRVRFAASNGLDKCLVESSHSQRQALTQKVPMPQLAQVPSAPREHIAFLAKCSCMRLATRYIYYKEAF